MPAPITSSPSSTAPGAITDSFLDILEQAGVALGESGENCGVANPGTASQANASQIADLIPQPESHTAIGSRPQRQSKPFDGKPVESKENESIGRGKAQIPAPTSSPIAAAVLTQGLQMHTPLPPQSASLQTFLPSEIAESEDSGPIPATLDNLASTVSFAGTGLSVSGVSASQTELSSAKTNSFETPLSDSKETTSPVIASSVTGSPVIDSKTSAAEVGVDEVNPTTPIPSSQTLKAPSAAVQSTSTDVNAVQSIPSQQVDREATKNVASPVVTVENPGSVITSGTDPNDKRTPVISSGGSTAKSAAADSQPLISSNETWPAKVHGNQSLEGPINPIPADAVQATIVANLIPGELKASAPDSKMKTGGESAPVAAAARIADRENVQDAVAAASDGSESATQSNIAHSSIVFPMSVPETLAASKMPLAPVKPTSDRVSFAPVRVAETAGTSGKSVESTTSATSQSRKDGSSSSLAPQASDQPNVAVPTKTIDASSALSVVGGQSLTSDGKNGNNAASLRESDPLPTSHADQESGGAAPHSVQPELQTAYPTSLINSAKLVERMGESELRLAMRTGEFGSVDIRTSMIRNQFTAEISVERSDLGRVMAAELPSLQNRLTEQAVPVASISLQNHNGGQPGAYEQQKPREGHQATNPVNRHDDSLAPTRAALEATASTSMSRLDVHM